MKEWIAFLLPPATAFVGMRINRLILGARLDEYFGVGLRFALGLGLGMLVFSQSILPAALVGINLSGALAWTALIWGFAELVVLLLKLVKGPRQIKFQPGYLWILLLLPVVYSWWIFGRLCTLEGTLDFDATAFWVFKAKIIYLEQGRNLLNVIHQSSLAYAHIDYPMLVSCLYALDYGAVGGVDEFVNKVWLFWMIVALSIGILSLGRFWRCPRPLPVLVVVLLCFLPDTMHFVRDEGAALPLMFYVSLSSMLIFIALLRSEYLPFAAATLQLAGAAATKYEGMIYCAVWFCILLPVMLRRGWLKVIAVWKAAGIGMCCLLPYVFYRLAHPVLHLANFWWQEGVSHPETMAHRFPNVWFLNVSCRFFSPDFFHWSGDSDGRIRWIGHWTGLSSLVNPGLSVLPWLLLFLLAISIWKKTGRARSAIACLSLTIVGVLTVLSIVITCFLSLQSLEGFHTFGGLMVDFSGPGEVGRYYYPFFVAWFLGMIAVWFPQEKTPITQPVEPKAAVGAAPRQKRRR